VPPGAQYRQIHNKIANLPRRDVLEMVFYPKDAGQIAAEVVWG
jgi:hypothetical protein